MKIIKLTPEDTINYIPMTDKYGHAMWTICPIIKYGKLKKVFIYPRQQPDKDCYYEVEFYNQDSFQIMSWIHQGYENPNIWLMFWCKEHKCIAYNVYADVKLNCIEFDSLSTAGIRFVKKEDEDKN